MTLPIIPGPFAFLNSAGQAAGAIGGALTERDRYQQALELQRQEAAQRNIGLLRSLGIVAPEAFAQPDIQKLFGQAGLPGLQPGQIEVPAATAVGRRQKSELARVPEGSAQSQLAVGIPTEAAADVDTAKGAEARKTLEALAEIVTPAQLRQYAHLLSPENAKIAEDVYLEKSKTELQQQDPLRIEAAMQSDIRKSVIKRLPRDPLFAKVADYAAVGGLGYLLQDLENESRFAIGSRALNTEKIKLVVATTNQASAAYKQARQQWEGGLNQARREALGIEGSTMDAQERAKKLNDVDKDYTSRNPLPTYDFFLDQALDASGLTKDDFQEGFRSLIHVPGAGAPESNPLQRVIDMYQRGELTDADIDASQKLSASQKTRIKSSKKRTP